MARRATAKQLAARKRFVAMVRSGSFRRKARRKKNPRGLWDAGIHRPRLTLSRGKRLETLRKHSPYRDARTGRPLITKVNKRRKRRNTQGATAMVSNRRRKHKTRRARARRNPVFFNARRRRRSRAKRNPVFFNKRRRHRMKRRRNPALSVKSILNRQFIMASLLAAGGFAIGIKTSAMIAKLPGVSMLGRFSGVAQVIVGSIVAMYARQAQLKALAGGFAAAGAYDLLAKNIPQLALPSLQGVDLMGDEGIDVVGDFDEGQYLTGGVDLEGDDDNAALVGASGSSMNTAY